ncbi:MAG TPA: type I secretion system permease/ATPase [Ramlibacter sp.]|nr:type I secretion system permease/ATPase [Ramlibacter sp.]
MNASTQQKNAYASNAPSELREALESLRPHLRRSAWFSTIAGLLVLMSTWYMLEVYDRVINSRSYMTLAMLTIMVLAAYALMEVLEWAHHEDMTTAGVKLDELIGDRVFMASFEANLKRVPGGTTQSLSDLKVIRDFLPSGLLKALMELPSTPVFLIVIFVISPYLGIAAVVGAILQTLVAWKNERATQPPLSRANRSSIAAQQYADGSLRNAQVIEAMGMLPNIHLRWLAKQREFLGLQALASEQAGIYTSMSKFLQQVLSSVLLGLACLLLLNRSLNGGAAMLIISSILGGRVLKPLVEIVTQWRVLVSARDAYNRLDTLLTTLPAKPEAMPLPVPRGKLTAENLIVSAPGTQVPILRGVNFGLNPGDVLAVIGPSASGKTTLARTLMGIWPSIGGKARLDGADVFGWDKIELGPNVGYLPQGVELFDGSIAENIARFGEVDMKKVETAAQVVGLHEFIMALPQGYETDVGPEGARLSGGQRQRVGLARALYGDPVFVVLDEPNSSLDDAGEAALTQAMTEAKSRGTTIIAITHRVSLLKACDKVLLLRDGQSQAFGPRDEVMAAIAKANAEAAAKAQAAAQQRTAAAQPELAA